MQQKTGCLYLCPTPIGNLEDITLRVLRVLKEADLIAAEDTRRTKKLLTHFQITTPLTSYREHNRQKKGAEIIRLLEEGKTVALVSDAGMPAISDPGYDLVVSALAEEIQVEALPGPSALLTALVASGISPVPFSFWGFLPLQGKKRREALQELSLEKKTVVLYEAPHRIYSTLEELFACCGDRQAALSRELTKKFAEVLRGSLKEIMEACQNREPRGEYTLVLAGREREKEVEEKHFLSLKEDVDILVGKGLSRQEALKEAARERGMSRREAYEIYHGLKRQ